MEAKAKQAVVSGMGNKIGIVDSICLNFSLKEIKECAIGVGQVKKVPFLHSIEGKKKLLGKPSSFFG